MGRGLVLPLVLDAGHDKHQDGDHVRCHGDKLFCSRTEARYQDAADIETAEEEGTEDAQHRFPQGEYYDSNCKPSPVAETIVGPGATGVVHNPVEAAQPRYNSTYYGGKILVLCHIDSGGVGSGRIFPHSPHVKAGSGPVEIEADSYGDNHCQVGQEAEVQPRNQFSLVPPSDGEEGDGSAVAEEA